MRKYIIRIEGDPGRTYSVGNSLKAFARDKDPSALVRVQKQTKQVLYNGTINQEELATIIERNVKKGSYTMSSETINNHTSEEKIPQLNENSHQKSIIDSLNKSLHKEKNARAEEMAVFKQEKARYEQDRKDFERTKNETQLTIDTLTAKYAEISEVGSICSTLMLEENARWTPRFQWYENNLELLVDQLGSKENVEKECAGYIPIDKDPSLKKMYETYELAKQAIELKKQNPIIQLSDEGQEAIATIEKKIRLAKDIEDLRGDIITVMAKEPLTLALRNEKDYALLTLPFKIKEKHEDIVMSIIDSVENKVSSIYQFKSQENHSLLAYRIEEPDLRKNHSLIKKIATEKDSIFSRFDGRIKLIELRIYER